MNERGCKTAALWLTVTLMLCSAISTGCSPVIVVDDARAARIEAGEPAPFAGWVLTDGAVIDLTECCEDEL